jgi:hypothetical protein
MNFIVKSLDETPLGVSGAMMKDAWLNLIKKLCVKETVDSGMAMNKHVDVGERQKTDEIVLAW